jgi:hypothetical protein
MKQMKVLFELQNVFYNISSCLQLCSVSENIIGLFIFSSDSPWAKEMVAIPFFQFYFVVSNCQVNQKCAAPPIFMNVASTAKHRSMKLNTGQEAFTAWIFKLGSFYDYGKIWNRTGIHCYLLHQFRLRTVRIRQKPLQYEISSVRAKRATGLNAWDKVHVKSCPCA